MLSVCEEFSADLNVKLNTSKSVAMRVGKIFNVHCAPLILAEIALKFVSTVRYLGVYLTAGTKWKLSVDHLKLKFYRVFNCIYSRCKSQNSESVTVELLKSYCLPFLLYASEAVSLSIGNIHSLDNCLNRAVHRIFNINVSDGIAGKHN